VTGSKEAAARGQLLFLVSGDVVALETCRPLLECFTPEFSLRWIQKDLHLASLSAYEAGVAMPVANVAKEVSPARDARGLRRPELRRALRIQARSGRARAAVARLTAAHE
jgi:3-hydroxyisobutyrate dehydrogenase-like beta-hydroxyacid dehydrogenase